MQSIKKNRSNFPLNLFDNKSHLFTVIYLNLSYVIFFFSKQESSLHLEEKGN